MSAKFTYKTISNNVIQISVTSLLNEKDFANGIKLSIKDFKIKKKTQTTLYFFKHIILNILTRTIRNAFNLKIFNVK